MTGLARRILLMAVMASVVPLVFSESAEARTQRYALIVGNNVGAGSEGRLRYAEADARKIYDVLLTLGEFRPEDSVLLLADTAAAFERVLIALNARIRAERSAGSETMLFVYYSGHADAAGLHLEGQSLDVERLRALVQGSAADFRMLLVDACRSGTLTRVKGGSPTPPFALRFDRGLAAEGVAFLTSSSANEDAQESDVLRGSFFTHYFVSGLRGAADRNTDGVVSVEEGYGYAYQHTLHASSETAHGSSCSARRQGSSTCFGSRRATAMRSARPPNPRHDSWSQPESDSSPWCPTRQSSCRSSPTPDEAGK